MKRFFGTVLVALVALPAFAQDAPDALTGKWLAEEISSGGVLDRVQTTIEIGADGAVPGSGGCNRIFGQAKIEGGSISFGAMGATRMACSPAIMDQEQKFLSALPKVSSWRVDGQAKLVLADGAGHTLVRLARMDRGAKIEIEMPGAATVQRTQVVYDCGSLKVDAEYINGGEVSLATLTMNGAFLIAANVLSGSGAKYAAGPYVWWTKGDEATLQDIREGEAAPGTLCHTVRP